MRARLLLLALTTALLSCDQPVPEADYEGLETCSDLDKRDVDYFESVMLPEFFEVYCTACHASDREGIDRHGAPDHLDFDVLEDATSVNSLVWSQVTARVMPPMGRTPSTAELESLLDWLNCNAPIPPYELDEALADDCPDPLLGWADAEPILADNCTRCHDSSLAAGDRSGAPETANYDTAAGVLAVGADQVWQRVFAGEMPVDDDPLPEDQAETLWAWLSCGGPD